MLVSAAPSGAQAGRWARAPEAVRVAPGSPAIITHIAPRPEPEPDNFEIIEKFRERWKLSSELSLTDQSGNRSLRLLTGALRLSHREKEAFELDGVFQTRYGVSEGETVARNHFASITFDLHPKDDWSPFLHVNAERDPFKRLDLRLSGGAGAKFRPFDLSGGDELSMSLALLYSLEDLRPSEADPNPQDREVGRLSFQLRASHLLTQTLRLQQNTSFEPIWDEMADYLLRSETGARVHLTERLALSITYALDRTARPPEGVKPDDRLLKTGLILDF